MEHGLWGKDTPLGFSDYKDYATAVMGENVQASTAAKHFGQEHVGDPVMIQKVEKQIEELEAHLAAVDDDTPLNQFELIHSELTFKNEMLKALKPQQSHHAPPGELRWGPGKALRLADMDDYIKTEHVDMRNSQGLTHVAYHYGRSHQNDPATIAATKAYRDELLLKLYNMRENARREGREQTQAELEAEAPIVAEIQIQSEALEYMDFESALRSQKREAINSFKRD